MQYTLVMRSTSTRGKWSTGRALVLCIQSESETNQLYDTIQLILKYYIGNIFIYIQNVCNTRICERGGSGLTAW